MLNSGFIETDLLRSADCFQVFQVGGPAGLCAFILFWAYMEQTWYNEYIFRPSEWKPSVRKACAHVPHLFDTVLPF